MATARTYDPTLAAHADSWALTLEAENKSARTVAIYTESVRYLADFPAERGMPTTVAHLSRGRVEAYLAHVLANRKASTASIRYRSLRRFFGWCAEDGAIAESPPTQPATRTTRPKKRGSRLDMTGGI